MFTCWICLIIRLHKSGTAKKQQKFVQPMEQCSHLDYYGLLDGLFVGSRESPYFNLPLTILGGIDACSIIIHRGDNKTAHPDLPDYANTKETVDIPSGHIVLMAG